MRIHPIAEDLPVEMSQGLQLGLLTILLEAFSSPAPAGDLMSDPLLVYRSSHSPIPRSA